MPPQTIEESLRATLGDLVFRITVLSVENAQLRERLAATEPAAASPPPPDPIRTSDGRP